MNKTQQNIESKPNFDSFPDCFVMELVVWKSAADKKINYRRWVAGNILVEKLLFCEKICN